MRENKQMRWAIRVTFLALAPAAAERSAQMGITGASRVQFCRSVDFLRGVGAGGREEGVGERVITCHLTN